MPPFAAFCSATVLQFAGPLYKFLNFRSFLLSLLGFEHTFFCHKLSLRCYLLSSVYKRELRPHQIWRIKKIIRGTNCREESIIKTICFGKNRFQTKCYKFQGTIMHQARRKYYSRITDCQIKNRLLMAFIRLVASVKIYQFQIKLIVYK